MSEFIFTNPAGPTRAVNIDEGKCVACNACANICRVQTILPNAEVGRPPVVAYPDECWYCGCCVEVCRTGALEMNLPINQRILFKRKETGEIFRIGGAECPEKSYFVPPYGWWKESNR
ncbi:MAG: 4Fe-4S binding protein [Eubacterium sp.]|nr:4Fe-4S binding protein [Eubacterium sp.]